MLEITAIKLAEVIATRESEKVEFKKSFNDEALESVGAFANARGGITLIGIKDSGEICGFQMGRKTLEDIANQIQNATDPRLQPSLSTVVIDKQNLLVIQVPSVTGAPVSVRGKYFKRTGKTNQRMSHEEIMQRMISSTGFSWDANVEHRSTLGDLNLKDVEKFIGKVKESGRMPIYGAVSPEEFLNKVELLQHGLPTRAALLLFGKNPESFFSSAFLKLGRFRSPTHIVDDREIHGNLFHQLDEAMNWFRERLETEFVINGKPQREVHWEYPLNAIREAITNAICHRDYTSAAHTQIRLYDDRLDISNAGALPALLTPETLLTEHDSIPRNRKVAEAFFISGLIERWGSGTLRIAEELHASGLPSPKFVSESNRFLLTLSRHFFTEELLRKKGLSERQLQVISYLKDHGNITNMEYQSITGVSKSTATRELNQLKKNGIIEMKGSAGRGTRYRLISS